MYLLKSPAALVALLLTVSLAAPTAEISQQAEQAPTAPAPVPDFSTSANDPNPPLFVDVANDQECGESSFIDQTSDASPTVQDCLQIATNIAGGGRWEVEAIIGLQHQLVEYGTCAFGVQRAQVGAFYFYVGNADIIDIINTSVDRFGSSGLVGAKGFMWCNPTLLSPGTNWGLYHTKPSHRRGAPNGTVLDSTTPANSSWPLVPFPSGVGESDCGASSFTDETSGGSPLVADCLQIATNIASGGRWNVDSIIGKQRQLVQFGTCAFGVQGKSVGAGSYFVGNQDIIDLIHSSIQMFAANSPVVGAKGVMPCNGFMSSPVHVTWGIYHTKSQSRSVVAQLLPAPANDTAHVP